MIVRPCWSVSLGSVIGSVSLLLLGAPHELLEPVLVHCAVHCWLLVWHPLLLSSGGSQHNAGEPGQAESQEESAWFLVVTFPQVKLGTVGNGSAWERYELASAAGVLAEL